MIVIALLLLVFVGYYYCCSFLLISFFLLISSSLAPLNNVPDDVITIALPFSFRDFILYLGFRCCRKFKNDVKGIERIGNLRRMILSEEFLFEIYFFFEEYHITLRKNNDTNTNMNTEYKNSIIGN